MPVHDWTRVELGVFHDFHIAWISELRSALNGGPLPPDLYGLIEVHLGIEVHEILTLPQSFRQAVRRSSPNKLTLGWPSGSRQRSLAIRNLSGHRLVALLEIVSPGNKDSPEHVAEFVGKMAAALDAGVHVAVIDILPPGRFDPQGMCDAVWSRLDRRPSRDRLQGGQPSRTASIIAEAATEVRFGPLEARGTFPDFTLHLGGGCSIAIPIDATYDIAYGGTPRYYRDILEQPGA